jgi:hypothetical protein
MAAMVLVTSHPWLVRSETTLGASSTLGGLSSGGIAADLKVTTGTGKGRQSRCGIGQEGDDTPYRRSLCFFCGFETPKED